MSWMRCWAQPKVFWIPLLSDMHLKVDLHQLEQHLEIVDEEAAICRRLKLELEQCQAQEMLLEDPMFWEREFRFLSEEREYIRNRQRVLTVTLEELWRANYHMCAVTDEAKHTLIATE